MDYKELYEQALERAKNLYAGVHKGCKEVIDNIFPELRESEDEKIRKELIQAIDEGRVFDIDKEVADRWIAYLEKQKEPHYTKRNALFDKCVENCDPEVMKEVSDKVDEMLEKEQKPVEVKDPFSNANFVRGYESGYNDAIREQKPAEWSEEDELTIADLINYFEGDSLECSTEEMVQRIKSLRPSWKPSEEQMEALRETIDFAPDTFKPKCTLAALQNDLKRLM